ncbi:MAG: radical SAM protein, partial [Nanoarchaeota archaeon]|nr:radical SAM protein [Nanoarchaeota archaeon]
MKILLANMPWFVGRKQGIRAGSRWPHLKISEEENYLPFPFFLAYATNLLKKNHFNAYILDAVAENISYVTFYKKIKKINPEIIFIETSTPSLNHDLKLVKKIKSFSKAKIVLGGMHLFDKNFLKENNCVDSIIAGEYEFSLLKLVKSFQKKKKMISYLKDPLHENLDDFPWPYNEELPMKKYHDCPGSIPSPSVQLWASRGCPYNCTFCAWPQLMYQPNKYRVRSVKDVVNEMDFLKKKGFKSFYFDDDTFNVGKNRILEICAEIKNRRINLPWAIMARADLMDKEILLAMKDVGLQALKYGIESSSQKLLDACNKNMNIKKVEKNILLTKKLGIKVHLTFTFGLPGETKKTIQDTINFALKMNPESVQFSITTPFPGTKYYEELKKKGLLLSTKDEDFDGNFKAVIKNKDLKPEYLEKAVRDAYRIWQEHKNKRIVNSNNPIKLFKECLKEHRIRYTINHTKKYLLETIHSLIKRKIPCPRYVTIDITNKCNLNCVGCWTFSPLLEDKKPEVDWFKQELEFSTIKKLVEELKVLGTKEIRITGGGEPFLHKDIFKIISLIKSKGLKLDITTNFTLLNREKILRLIKLGVDNITVSIWAGDKETYEKTHPKNKNNFKCIKENLRYLSKINKKSTNKTKVVLANVISSVNYDKIENMIRFGEEVGSDEIYFTLIDSIKNATDKLLLNEEKRKELLTTFLKIEKRNHKIKIDSIDNIIRKLSNPKAIKGQYDSKMLHGMKCYVGNVFSRIMANGDVAPCCRAVKNVVGNINKQSFKDIWSGRIQEEFRKNGLEMSKKFTEKIGCYKTCDNWWENVKYNKKKLVNHLTSNNVKMTQKKVLMVICPFWDVKYPPIGIAYISSFLRSKGIKTEVLDANIKIFHQEEENQKYWDIKTNFVWKKHSFFNKFIEQISQEILSSDNQIIAFSIMTPNLEFSLEVIKRVKKKNPNKIIITGGVDAPIHKSKFIDYHILGEGEKIMFELVTAIIKKKETDKIPNLIIYKNNNQIKTKTSTIIQNIHELPFPTYEEFDLTKYTEDRIGLIGSRGCINKCVFCNDWVVWKNFKFRKAEDIVSEIEFHIKNNNKRNFEFFDLLINGNIKQLRDFCNLLIKRKIDIEWSGNAIIRKEMTLELLQLMKKAGCSGLTYGIESGSNKILKLMGKNFTREEAINVLIDTKQAGIHINVNIIVGFP